MLSSELNIRNLNEIGLRNYKIIDEVDGINLMGCLHNSIDLQFNDIISHKYFYLDIECAYNWVRVAGARDYYLAKQARKMIQQKFSLIIEKIYEESSKLGKIGLLSLGVGDGKDDLEILKQLYNKEPEISINYLPLDISYDLLIYTIRQVEKDTQLQNKIFDDRFFSSTIIHLDFENLSIIKELIQKNNSKLLVTFLGSTISNFEDEESILVSIRDNLKDDDFLLIGVDCSLDIMNEKSIIIKNKKSEEGKSFLLSPLRSVDALGHKPPKNITTEQIEVVSAPPRYKSSLINRLMDKNIIDELKINGHADLVSSVMWIIKDYYKKQSKYLTISHKYKENILKRYFVEIGYSTILTIGPDPESKKDENNYVAANDDCKYVLFLLKKMNLDEKQKHISGQFKNLFDKWKKEINELEVKKDEKSCLLSKLNEMENFDNKITEKKINRIRNAEDERTIVTAEFIDKIIKIVSGEEE